MTQHYVNDSATAEWLRECADLEHSDGEWIEYALEYDFIFDEFDNATRQTVIVTRGAA